MKSITFLCAFALCCLTTYQGISQVFSIRVSVRDNSCSNFPTGRITCDNITGVLPITWKISSSSRAITDRSAIFTRLAPGTHKITAIDATGAVATETVTVKEITISLSSFTAVTCNRGNDGTIVLTSINGTPPLGFNLFSSSNGSFSDYFGTFTGLFADDYTISSSECRITGTTLVKITQPSLVVNVTTPSVTNVTCNGGNNGKIVVSASGGTGAITYDISPNSGTQSPAGTFNGLTAGNYAITAHDASTNCTTLFTTVEQPTVLSATSTAGSIACNGGTTTVNVTATGGTAPYTGIGSFTRGVGNYSFTVTDANGCTKTTSVTITEPTALTVTSSAGTIVCNNGTTIVVVSATGGTAPYLGTSSFLMGAGTYTFTVVDANACSKTTSITIPEPMALSATSTADPIACNGGTTTINVTATGGTAPYTGTGSFTRGVGNYSFTVTDANGCTQTTSITITEPTALSATSSAGPIACNGGTTTVNVNATGGTAPYTGTGSFTRGVGNYSFTVTDANGCTKTTSVIITQPTIVTVNAGSCQYVYLGYGSNCTNISASASGGGGTYTYKWSPGNLSGATTNVCPTSTTIYTVTATDQNGCKGTNTVKVEVIDVRCEKNKVKVCHSGTTLCVDKIGVPDHLAHGDKLGTCNLPTPCSSGNNIAAQIKTEINGYTNYQRNVIGFTTNQGSNTDYWTDEKLNKASGNYEALEIHNNKDNTYELQYLTFYDNAPDEGENLYRIKQTYMSGDITYSDIQKIDFTKSQDFIIYPNPASEEVFIDLKSFEGRQVSLVITDLVGKTLQQEVIQKAATLPHRLDVSSLSTGLYFIKLQTKGKRAIIQKLQVIR